MKYCPNCRFDVSVKMHETRGAELLTFALTIINAETRTNILRSALLAYWRWVSEGRPPRYESWTKPPVGQFYYDDYHDHVEYRDGRYYFSIQTHDSPDGDIWWSGSFKLGSQMQIEDLLDR